MIRRLIVVILIALIGLGTAPVVMTSVSVEAIAQNKRPSLLQRLFRPLLRLERGPVRRSTPSSRSTRRAAPSAPAVPTVEVQEKDPDARQILVIGDFVAGGLAWGLEQTYAEEPKLAIVDRSEANSGLARQDRFDWNATLPDVLNEVQPDLVVVVLGINDRQQIRLDNARLAVRSDEWVEAYTSRIAGLVETLKVYGRPFFWVSAPPVRSNTASSDMAFFNGLYKPRVQEVRGFFVDIWNGFANEDGRYIASGPDVEGQVRQLRTRDGINFTRAGRLKLAFYVDREIRRQTGFGSGGIDLLATVTQGNQIEIDEDGTKRLVGPIISLNNPLPGSIGELAGGEQPSLPTEESSQFKVIVRGEALPGVAGRVDDFSWPPQEAEELIPTETQEPVAEVSGIPIPVERPETAAN